MEMVTEMTRISKEPVDTIRVAMHLVVTDTQRMARINLQNLFPEHNLVIM
jgi:hypothetical protein